MAAPTVSVTGTVKLGKPVAVTAMAAVYVPGWLAN
jgi:hypothetical protein